MIKKRICLAIDTTSPTLGLALHDLAAHAFPCLGRIFEIPDNKQTDVFFPTLDRLLKKSRLRRSDLALIAVDHGPGSFTGVRVGVAAARGIAQGLDIPVIGIGALEIIAWEAAGRIIAPRVTVAARLPALAGDAYIAVFERSAKGAWKTTRAPVWTTEAKADVELAKLARAGAHLAYIERADATPLFPQGLTPHKFTAPDPSALARLAFLKCGSVPSWSKFTIEKTIPIYLQPSWAERSKKLARARV